MAPATVVEPKKAAQHIQDNKDEVMDIRHSGIRCSAHTQEKRDQQNSLETQQRFFETK